MKAIIPAAGYGTRMGMASHEAKELLPDSSGRKLIDYSLELCKRYSLDPCVIVRAAKTELCQYLRQRNIEMFVVPDNTFHMSDSVLRARDAWQSHNILLLPDCRFSPEDAIKDIQKMLVASPTVLGIFPVTDPHNWGVVRNLQMWEHPKDLPSPQLAWGLIGWRYAAGIPLFHAYAEACRNGVQSPLPLHDSAFLPLDYFEDLTH